MKKVAFILALAFVFLVGEKIVFEHKIWAGEIAGKKIVLWIPVNGNGEFDLNKIKLEDYYKAEKFHATENKYKVPFSVEDWKNIIHHTNNTVLLVEKNPRFCWVVCSEGACTEECIVY